MQPGPFTMTGDEFKDVYNGLCHMWSAVERLGGVVHPSIVKELKKGIELMEKGLDGLYKQEEAANEVASDLVEKVSDELNLKHAIISLDGVLDFDATPFPKANKLVYYTVNSDRTGYNTAQIEIPERSTWKDLLKAADYLIEQSGDFHHVFVESIGPVNEVVPHEIVQVVVMSTGS